MIEQLYRQHYRQLLRFCISLTKNPAFAEDIVQDAFMRALAHADLLADLSEAKCLSWLYKTARNLFIDQVRRLTHAPKGEPEAMFEEDLSTVHVAQMLSRLPESERALFSLRYFHGYNATELGEMFDLPSSTVRARLLSARKYLQQIMKDE